MIEILNTIPLRSLQRSLFTKSETELVRRPASFIIRSKTETSNRIRRIIVLCPNGFTADHRDELNPHPETRLAKITFRGGVRPGKIGFSILKDALKFRYLETRNVETLGEHPYVYAASNLGCIREESKSTKETFFVVKENGVGFYHSLVNLTDDWLVLLLEKELRHWKKMDLSSVFERLEPVERRILIEFMNTVSEQGDTIFDSRPELVDEVANMQPDTILPTLVEGLNIQETGKHEVCTIYAIILKVGKRYPQKVASFLAQSMSEGKAPEYYLIELMKKVRSVS